MDVFSWLDWVRKNITYLKELDNKNISNRPNTERLFSLFVPKNNDLLSVSRILKLMLEELNLD
jgi:hypothetical protein